MHGDGDDEQEDPAPVVVPQAALGSDRQVPDGDSLLCGVAAGLAVAAAHESATLPTVSEVHRTLLGDG